MKQNKTFAERYKRYRKIVFLVITMSCYLILRELEFELDQAFVKFFFTFAFIIFLSSVNDMLNSVLSRKMNTYDLYFRILFVLIGVIASIEGRYVYTSWLIIFLGGFSLCDFFIIKFFQNNNMLD